eukprot:scaffold77762_cov49-Attheya_sp.AAC.6
MAEATTAAHVEQRTEEENARDTLCSLFLEDFIAVTAAPSALVDVDWRCRRCAKIAAYHLHRPQKEQQQQHPSPPVQQGGRPLFPEKTPSIWYETKELGSAVLTGLNLTETID